MAIPFVSYFCWMIRALIISAALFAACNCCAQIRLTKLVLEPKEKFIMEKSDIIVVDTLIMKDSSTIFLNMSKTNNFIHAKEVLIGKNCSIVGQGANGTQGIAGDNGLIGRSPCRSGAPAANAAVGSQGQNATNVSLYFNTITITGSIIINLNGGDGGDGGKGGRGGDGGSGTRVCVAGDGGKGGNGANGGVGGDGGSVTISCKKCDDLHLIMGNKLIVKNFGGFGGVGGDGGTGGQAGLGPAGDGKNGQRGIDGDSAAQGKTGSVNLSRN
jgi:hypothetical protein